jgi:hypothetical protein
MNWKIFPNRIVRDMRVHMYYEPEAQKTTVMVTRDGKAVGWIIFEARNPAAGTRIMAVECRKHGDSDVLLAGWQWARSEHAVSRQTYKEGREWLLGVVRYVDDRKRVRRHALTKASSKIISTVMRGKQ